MAVVTDQELTEAIILAGRTMVGIAVRSLAADEEHEVTLPQYRTLVALSYGGPSRLADLAAELGVSPSTATRMCDRLVRKGLITRTRDDVDRREVNLAVTDEGRKVVDEVIERRRVEVREILKSIPDDARSQLLTSLQVLAVAAGEAPEMHWAPGWTVDNGSA
ncbi:MAG: MarR family winged helix-turn-helix transcriptional regulator [Acidimicrobiales bacterium]